MSDDSTGLPWPRTWPGVYRLVIVFFVVDVVLLLVLKASYP